MEVAFSTPKNLRIQAITNNMDTPIRRRSGINVNTSIRSSEIINDDEAERRRSRRIEEESPSASASLVEDAETLNMCLQLHSENKISKHNAWTVAIIDSFSKLIQKHHKTLQNFQIAGSTLEASTKVYGLRVDSVYNDTVRMSSELSRQSAKSLNKRLDGTQDEDDDENQENDPNITNEGGPSDKNAPGPKKKQKKRRNISTVTKNKDTINAKLDTVPFTDPFFAKLNSVVGDINSSKRLMQNIIPTQSSLLKLRQNLKFWDGLPANPIDIETGFTVAEMPQDMIISSLTCISGPLRDTLSLQGTLSAYQISDSPLENDEDDSEMRNDFNATLNHTQQLNNSQLELQFDINAEVEPLNQDNNFVVDYGDMDNNDFGEMNEEEHTAILRCRGLKRQAVLIEDMQPVENSSALEYSYRPLENIGQFWAGPSHWKFRRTTKSSIGARFSQMGAQNQGQLNKAAAKKKRTRKIATEITVDDFLGFKSTHVAKTTKLRMTSLSRQTIGRKWDNRKLKLPNDYKVDQEIFNKFKYAPNFKPSNVESTLTPDDDNEYNYNNDSDRNYCSRVEAYETDTETETDVGQMDNALDMPENQELPPAPPHDMTVDFISNEYIGAPDKVEKIQIAFAKRAKVVDMKQLKKCCWHVINSKKSEIPQDFDADFPDLSSLDHCKTVNFNNVVKELPKLLSKNMSQNMSIPLAFYSVLHLANENFLFMNQHNDLEDFDIIAKD